MKKSELIMSAIIGLMGCAILFFMIVTDIHTKEIRSLKSLIAQQDTIIAKERLYSDLISNRLISNDTIWITVRPFGRKQ